MLSKIVFLVSVLAAYAQATALTFALQPNEKQCFYVFNNKPNSNIGYYFAVQAGGSFDINYYVKSPNGNIVVQADKLTHADYILNADQVGEYEFCLSNEMSTFAEKIVDFEVKVDDDFKAELPDAPKQNAAVEGMQQSVVSIEKKLDQLQSSLNYYKTRNNRNQSTVKSTEDRIFWFSIIDLILMVSMSAFQVLVVKYFFQGSRKQMV